MNYSIRNERDVGVGEYSLTPMPGCFVVGISHGLQVFPEYRGQGYGVKGYLERLAKARELGFQVLIATVVDGNKKEESFLEKDGWKPVTIFDNPKTGNRVRFWVKNLTDPYNCGFYEGHGCR